MGTFRKRKPKHEHEWCERCHRDHDVLAWQRVQLQRIQTRMNNIEKSFLMSQYHHRQHKGLLYQTIAALRDEDDSATRQELARKAFGPYQPEKK